MDSADNPGSAQECLLLQQQLEALRTENTQLRRALDIQLAVFNAIPYPVFHLDAQANFRAANPAYAEIGGGTTADVAGQSVRDMATQALHLRLTDKAEETMASAGSLQREMLLPLGNGSLHETLFYSVGYRMPDGTPGGIVGTMVDITDRKNAERATAAMLKEQQAIFASVDIGIAFFLNGLFRICNQIMEHMFGYAPGELAGTDPALLFVSPQEWHDTSTRAIASLQDTGRFSEERQMRRKDGTLLWVHSRGCRLDRNDTQQGSVWLYEDTTEQRRVLEEIRHAKEQAEAATRMKSDFLANMSHEIRTPMNAIIGMAFLALQTELTPRQREYMHKIEQSSKHLLGILNDILDFSKVAEGKLQIELTPFALDAVMRHLATAIGGKAAHKGLEFTCAANPDVPPNLLGDPLRLGQILTNYATNAVKFTETGSIAITVQVQEASEHVVQLKFVVQDTGIGMAPEQMGSLFQSFTQGDATSTRKYGGTGMGLAINKRLAELMGGTVGVDSRLGEGSVFWFTARFDIDPIRTQASTPLLQPTPPLLQATPPQAANAGLDTPDDRQLLARLQALLAEDDAEAAEVFDRHFAQLLPLLGTSHAKIASAIAQFNFEKAHQYLQDHWA